MVSRKLVVSVIIVVVSSALDHNGIEIYCHLKTFDFDSPPDYNHDPGPERDISRPPPPRRGRPPPPVSNLDLTGDIIN